jgi:hypothetical protein
MSLCGLALLARRRDWWPSRVVTPARQPVTSLRLAR